MIDVASIKKDFPIFANDPALIYLDSTATSLKPLAVIMALERYYKEYSANIFRGIYSISEKATEEYEATRASIAAFINASPDEIVFTRNATESLNLLCGYAGSRIGKGDAVITSIAEHHSNFVPWQQLCLRKEAGLKILGLTEDGALEDIRPHVTKRTRMLALTYVSNVLGTCNNIKQIIAQAKSVNPDIITVIDASQAVPHRLVDVADLGADFIAFSSHKMLGPTGVGVLWGRIDLLSRMEPVLFGGEMIREVYKNRTVFRETPHRFEAGTPAIAEVIALKEAVAYLKKVGMYEVESHEKELGQLAAARLREEFPHVHIVGPKDRKERGGIVSFYFEDIHAHDIAQVLAERGICVRAGHHCAMPLHDELGIDATVRASFYIYNDTDDVEKLIAGIHRALKVLT